MEQLEWDRTEVEVEGVGVSLATLARPGGGPPVVVLHGFGSTKEDWLGLAVHPRAGRRGFLAYDAPGSGDSGCDDPRAVSVPFLVRTAELALDRAGVGPFHLVGHSMGGLTGLLLAGRHPGRVLSFVDVEGNLGPEDCFLSRQVLTHPEDDPVRFLDAFVERARRASDPGSAPFAAGLRGRVRPEVVRPVLGSMVGLSDAGDLLATFLGLDCPRMFVHGQPAPGASYLPALRAAGVRVEVLDGRGHWPMLTDPVALWDLVAGFHDEVDA